MRLFLCGDVMTGRGIDQIMPRQCDPVLYERHMHSALGYVELAERRSGPIPHNVPADYIWGDALAGIESRKPDLRIANLETSITENGEPEPKGINYRMHPDNVGCIRAARIDCCVLANNHVRDWGEKGFADTLEALQRAGIASAGAGMNLQKAARPAILETASGKRLLVFAFGCPSSGVPEDWAAAADRPGVNFLDDLGAGAVARIADDVAAWRRPGDIVLASIHWGYNWGYDIPDEHRAFARDLLDRAGIDIIHGHSSHHPKAIEIHAGKPILYGAGDFLNDYEGIGGYEDYRPDLAIGYILDIDERSHLLAALEMVVFRITKFRLVRASGADAGWLARRFDRECGRFGGHVEKTGANMLALSW